MNHKMLGWSRGATAIFSLLLVGAGCNNNTSTTDASVTPDVTVMDAVMDVPPVDVQPDVPARCTSNASCATSAAGPVCDTASGQCVGCNTTPDTCTAMQYCDPIGRRCNTGCHGDDGCTGGQHCDTTTHACVACTMDAQCPAGNLCRGNACVMGCSTGTMCPMGSSCCNGGCVNTQTNLADCGACGNLCRAPNGVPSCTAGVCGIGMCTAPYADCDMMASNGCETDTQSSATNCGMCGNACMTRPNSTPTCAAGVCAFTCAMGFADCDADAANGCETDVRTSATNCGACGRLCNPANAMGTCTDGTCRVGGCNMGFADCDMDTATGCETPTATNPAACGACGNACPARPNSTPTCAAGACGIRCADGFADCDGMADNGCEVDTRSDLMNCGRCTAVCAPTGGSAACSAGVCGVTACATGFGDCDGDASNGCETDVRTNSTHCGMCRNSCIAGPSSSTTCSASSCRLTCASGFGDCDNSPLNGCEVNTNVSPTNCGACGTVCSTGQVCNAGVCETPCPGVQTRCGGTCVDLDSNAMNCGTCGTACATGNACMGGVCVCRTSGTPTTSPYNGVACGAACIDVLSNNTNCGGCGVVCATGSTCIRGTCRCTTTSTGLLGVFCGTTCVDTVSNHDNCGRCGNACGASETCVIGICRCITSTGAMGATCSGVCSDPQTDRNNCGSCGNACPSTQECFAGACRNCPSGQTLCAGRCVNLQTDNNNCNACGTVCPSARYCLAGACSAVPLYHGYTCPIAGCLTTSFNATAATNQGGTYPYNTGDSNACRAWKLAATVCTTAPTLYGSANENWYCPTAGGFTDPVFGTYCLVSNQYSCSTCPGACNASCVYTPLSLRNCSGSEASQP